MLYVYINARVLSKIFRMTANTAGQLFFVCEHVSETGHVFIARVQETSKFIIQS